MAPLRAPVEALRPGDLQSIGAVSNEIRGRICGTPLPEALSAELTAAYSGLHRRSAQSNVAVRSSATTEDASDASFAGLQDTYLWVGDAERMLDRVRSCWASLYSVES